MKSEMTNNENRTSNSRWRKCIVIKAYLFLLFYVFLINYFVIVRVTMMLLSMCALEASFTVSTVFGMLE